MDYSTNQFRWPLLHSAQPLCGEPGYSLFLCTLWPAYLEYTYKMKEKKSIWYTCQVRFLKIQSNCTPSEGSIWFVLSQQKDLLVKTTLLWRLLTLCAPRQDTLRICSLPVFGSHTPWMDCLWCIEFLPSSSFQKWLLDGFNLRQFSSSDCIKLESNWGKVISGKIPSQEIFYLRKLYTEAANSKWKA